MNVGIRELKARLSEYVARASNGDHIVVTDRGRPVARLVGFDGVDMLNRGIQEGWITPASSGRLEPVARCKAASGTADTLDEDRG